MDAVKYLLQICGRLSEVGLSPCVVNVYRFALQNTTNDPKEVLYGVITYNKFPFYIGYARVIIICCFLRVKVNVLGHIF